MSFGFYRVLECDGRCPIYMIAIQLHEVAESCEAVISRHPEALLDDETHI